MLFQSRLAVARKKLEAKDFKAAESRFEICLKDTTQIRAMPQHEVVEINLDLAAACNGAKNIARQLAVLLSLTKLGLPESQQFHLNHMLGALFASQYETEMARNHARVAMEGRLKIYGQKNRSYQGR